MKKVNNIQLKQIKLVKSYGFVQGYFVPPHIVKEASIRKYGRVAMGPKGPYIASTATSEFEYFLTQEDVEEWRKVVKDTDSLFDMYLAMKRVFHDDDPRLREYKTVAKYCIAINSAWPLAIGPGCNELIVIPDELQYPSLEEREAANAKYERMRQEADNAKPQTPMEFVVEWLRSHDPRAEAMQDVQWRWEGEIECAILSDAVRAGYSRSKGLPTEAGQLLDEWLKPYNETAIINAQIIMGMNEVAKEITKLTRE